MITAHTIYLSFGAQPIYNGISFMLDQKQRVGLVGRNGSGKSTLLKAIAGQQPLDDGSITIAKGKKIAYLPQEVVLTSDKSIVEEAMGAFANIIRLEQEAQQLESLIHTNADAADRYVTLQEQLVELNPDRARAQAKRILMGLGFHEKDFNNPVSILSVGWKMRIVLAKLLLQEADFYLFDEPTNHLDIVANEWLVEFLARAPFGFMIVSHDRYVLDQLCTTILELEQGNGKRYTGNYSAYERQKEHDMQLLESAYAQQQKEIKRKMSTIERFKAKSSKAKMAKSMLKSLGKIERISLPPSPKDITFTFPPVKRPGSVVLTVDNIAHAFGDKQLFKNVSFEVKRSEKVGIIAPNGVGKTTLFNLIAGKYPLQTGSITFGHNVEHAIFDQDQTASLAQEKTILQNIHNDCSNTSTATIRSFLGAFLFSNDTVDKKVKVLSGGEKNRVGMVRTLLQQANLLLLDEPTNHLDIPSKEILLKALQAYQGTMLFVSHDHMFVNNLATRIIELGTNGIMSFEGNYEDFLHYKQQRAKQKTESTKVSQRTSRTSELSNKEQYALTKKNKALEKKIHKLEQEISKIEHSFAALQYGTEEFYATEQKLKGRKQDLATLMKEWESVVDTLD